METLLTLLLCWGKMAQSLVEQLTHLLWTHHKLLDDSFNHDQLIGCPVEKLLPKTDLPENQSIPLTSFFHCLRLQPEPACYITGLSWDELQGNTPNLLAVRVTFCIADSVLTHCSLTRVKSIMHVTLRDP